jgi:Gas vesicle synthesis protein GvpL/GvpF
MVSRYYLYGIFPSPGPAPLAVDGLDQQPVQTYCCGEFAFLYSATDQARYLASRKHLLTHERVLEAAMHQGERTLLPLQFGLIIESWQQIQQQLLVPHGQGLKRLFEHLTGRREVSLKVVWDEAVELELMLQQNEDLRRQRDRLEGQPLSMDQVVRIGQVIEQAMGDRRATIAATCQALLNPLALAVQENEPLGEAMIYNAAYLIDWDDEPAFAQAVEALDRQFEDRLRLRYNNFTAPFNFAQLAQLD